MKKQNENLIIKMYDKFIYKLFLIINDIKMYDKNINKENLEYRYNFRCNKELYDFLKQIGSKRVRLILMKFHEGKIIEVDL